MPLLLGIFTAITTFVGSLFAQMLLIFGRKFTVGTATVLAYVATTLAFVICINELFSVVMAAVAIPAWILTAISWFIPSNFLSVIASITSGRVCRLAYQVTVKKISLMNSAA